MYSVLGGAAVDWRRRRRTDIKVDIFNYSASTALRADDRGYGKWLSGLLKALYLLKEFSFH